MLYLSGKPSILLESIQKKVLRIRFGTIHHVDAMAKLDALVIRRAAACGGFIRHARQRPPLMNISPSLLYHVQSEIPYLVGLID